MPEPKIELAVNRSTARAIHTHNTYIDMRSEKNVLKKIPVQTTLVPRINLFLSRRYALNGCYDLVQANFLHHHKESSIFSVRCNVLCSASPEYLMEWKYVIFFTSSNHISHKNVDRFFFAFFGIGHQQRLRCSNSTHIQ